MALELALDCKHYLGDRPCRFKQRCHCEHYEPMGHRILIIKLGALGDVVRTASLLPSLKRAWPSSHITWVSKPNGVRILKGHPLIDVLMAFDAEGWAALTNQKFDLVISLDKEPAPTALCDAVDAPDKRGILMSQWGTAEPCEERCEPYFELGLDDELKFFKNTKTYPELIHEALGLDYVREPYRLYFPPEAGKRAEQMFAPWRKRCTGAIIGLNTGAGNVFANKAPEKELWRDTARLLMAAGNGIVLLGGPGEREQNEWIAEQLDHKVWSAGCDNTEQQFTAIIDQCDLVLTGDTLGLHVAVAREVPVLGFFGPTCEQEIDLFGRGAKLLTKHKCSPCYLRQCPIVPTCMEDFTPEWIASTVEEILTQCPPKKRPE